MLTWAKANIFPLFVGAVVGGLVGYLVGRLTGAAFGL